jgi:hypothetical protein
MAAATLIYAGDPLAGTNLAGKLKQNAEGYYLDVVLGALDVFNSAGAMYTSEPALALFQENTTLMRQAKNRALRGEYGHPKRAPGQTIQEFVRRCCTIYEDCVSHHMTNLRLVPTDKAGAKGKKVILILADIKPCGPHGTVLKAQLDNPNENVCFSIRSLTEDVMVNGVMEKRLRTIITWDYVNEPGISYANKFASPSLECHYGDDVVITQDIVLSLQREYEAQGIGNESYGLALEAVIQAFDLSAIAAEQHTFAVPASAKW